VGEYGPWAGLLNLISDMTNPEYLMLDNSVVRLHPHGPAKIDQEQEAMDK